MTTSVTIDAHAGWDVEVISESFGQPKDYTSGGTPYKNQTVTRSIYVVPANTKRTFYVHDSEQIVSVKELPRVRG